MQTTVKLLRAIVISTGSLLVSAANAQNSITLYGIIDTGLTYVNNGGAGSQYLARSSDYYGNRWGLRGVEDLGGGMKAVFVLENGFDPLNGKLGQSGRLFGRQAYVGISSPYGDLTAGRQYDFMLTMVGPMTASQRFAGYIGTRPVDVDALDGAYRNNNSIRYFNTTGPLSYGVMYGFGNVAGSLSHAMYGAGAQFKQGALQLGVAMSNYRNPAETIYDGASPAASGVYTNPVSSPITSGYSSAQREQIFTAGINYAIGNMSVGGSYSNVTFHGIVPTSTTVDTGSAKFNTFEGLVDYRFAPDFLAGLSYAYSKTDTAHYSQLQTGAIYSLSKRTSLYSIVVWQHASGEGSNGKPAVAQITLMSPSSTANQVAVHAGIIHRF